MRAGDLCGHLRVGLHLYHGMKPDLRQRGRFRDGVSTWIRADLKHQPLELVLWMAPYVALGGTLSAHERQPDTTRAALNRTCPAVSHGAPAYPACGGNEDAQQATRALQQRK